MEPEALQAQLDMTKGQIRALNLLLLAIIPKLPPLALAHGAVSLAMEVEGHEQAAEEEDLSATTASVSLAMLTAYRDLLHAAGK